MLWPLAGAFAFLFSYSQGYAYSIDTESAVTKKQIWLSLSPRIRTSTRIWLVKFYPNSRGEGGWVVRGFFLLLMRQSIRELVQVKFLPPHQLPHQSFKFISSPLEVFLEREIFFRNDANGSGEPFTLTH